MSKKTEWTTLESWEWLKALYEQEQRDKQALWEEENKEKEID